MKRAREPEWGVFRANHPIVDELVGKAVLASVLQPSGRRCSRCKSWAHVTESGEQRRMCMPCLEAKRVRDKRFRSRSATKEGFRICRHCFKEKHADAFAPHAYLDRMSRCCMQCSQRKRLRDKKRRAPVDPSVVADAS